ncbi:hypothetical protein M569_08665, partial [Genlisea aurea]
EEEKIFVAIRLRPLNERELSKNDVSEWDCINDTTVVFNNSLQERSLLPAAYTFDRVFGFESPTRQVYNEAAKKIALSAISGINSTIFAYGQTSSGKTYTMTGVTEYAVADIYDYISKHDERKFILKFAAIEIYNESVRDLLSPDATSLRLLDDPERGTVIDKLTEISLKGCNHLKELLSICEAQRQIGETSLNEMSSRSHQILRLTIESESRHYSGAANASSLTASVNFVDLAGSERASQTMSAGTRLKEGSHINRSLLTLGTVIRKLSKGRSGHVPYRDSKLTRILQTSLGGNARTAIICTMSPAHSHVEQSRNTLLFASCAKQVNTNAHVNIVMSEKALVKQLQKELARLETELKNLRSLSAVCASASALNEKELIIQKMDREIKELTGQRDLAQSHIEDMIRSGADHHRSRSWIEKSWNDGYSPSESSEIIDPLRFDVASTISSGTHFSEKYQRTLSTRIEDHFLENNEEQFFSDDTSPGLYIDRYFGPDPCKGWEKISQETNQNDEDNCKEVQCIEMELTSNSDHSTISSPEPAAISGYQKEKLRSNVERSKSCEAILECPYPEMKNESENRTQNVWELSGAEKEATNIENLVSEDSIDKTEKEQNFIPLTKKSTEVTEEARVKNLIQVFEPKSVNELESDALTTSPDLEEASPKELNEAMEPETDADTTTPQNMIKPEWNTEFERQMREIIHLWDACHIPLTHRACFFLLFRGDPSDAVYLEVEQRRLAYLKNTLHGVVKDDQLFKQTSSTKALNHEREMLSRRMLKMFTTKEREALFNKWGIDLKSKQRRLQLCKILWADSQNMEHINESADIVAKLVGFKATEQAPKEMFGLSFSPKPANFRTFSWKHN